MVIASGKTFLIRSYEIEGRAGVGNTRGISPNLLPMVSRGRLKK